MQISRPRRQAEGGRKSRVMNFINRAGVAFRETDSRWEAEFAFANFDQAWKFRSPAGQDDAGWQESRSINVLEFTINHFENFFDARFDNFSHVSTRNDQIFATDF